MTRRWGHRKAHGRSRNRRGVSDGVPAPVVERGSFAHAFCGECGWEGPGRRSRGVAALDADGHARTGCTDLAVPLAQTWSDVGTDGPDQLRARP